MWPSKSGRHYAWMNGTSLEAGTCSSFEQAMRDWRYPVETDDNGNVIDINFSGEKLGDEDQLWSAIAPFVTAGSYIAMMGEDGSHWRWFFDGATATEHVGTVSYE